MKVGHLVLVSLAALCPVASDGAEIAVTRISNGLLSSWAGDYLVRFPASTQLKWSDGFFTGAAQVMEGDLPMRMTAFAEYDDAVYFASGEYDGPRQGAEWYRFHPDVGVTQVAEMRTSERFGGSMPRSPFVAADKLFFYANGRDGYELHVYDGETTRQVADVFEGPESSFRDHEFIPLNDKIIFEAISSAPFPINQRTFLYSLDPVAESVTQIGDRHYPSFTESDSYEIGGFVADGRLYGEIAWGDGRIYSTDGESVDFELDIERRWSTGMYQGRPYVHGFDADRNYFLRELIAGGVRDVPVVGNGGIVRAAGPHMSEFMTYQLETDLGIEYAVLDGGQLKILRLFEDVPARYVSILSSSTGRHFIRAYRDGDENPQSFFFVSDDNLLTFRQLSTEESANVQWAREGIGHPISPQNSDHEFTPLGYFKYTRDRGLLHIDETEMNLVEHVSATGKVTRLFEEQGSKQMYWHNDAFYYTSEQGTYKITASDSVARVDYNHNGIVDVEDLDIQRRAMSSETYLEAFDLEFDGVVDSLDRAVLVEQFAKTTFGDANLDGRFNSSDLVQVFISHEYEDGVPENSTWAEGDWNGDYEFDATDLVFAFLSGGYASDSALSNVPEPSARLFAFFALFCLLPFTKTRVCEPELTA